MGDSSSFSRAAFGPGWGGGGGAAETLSWVANTRSEASVAKNKEKSRNSKNLLETRQVICKIQK